MVSWVGDVLWGMMVWFIVVGWGVVRVRYGGLEHGSVGMVVWVWLCYFHVLEILVGSIRFFCFR